MERKVVTTWVLNILSTNEKGNYIAHSLDCMGECVEVHKQGVLNSLNIGMSVRQLKRLRQEVVQNYYRIMVQYVIRKSNAVNKLPSHGLLLFDDDYTEGWWKKFVNNCDQVLQYMKNLTVVSIDILESPRLIGVKDWYDINIITVPKVLEFYRNRMNFRNGFLDCFLTSMESGKVITALCDNHIGEAVAASKSFTLGNMRKHIQASRTAVSYSAIIEKGRLQGNATPIAILQQSFRTRKEHAISMLTQINLPPVIETLRYGYVFSLGDYPKWATQTKLQQQFRTYGYQHAASLFKAAAPDIFEQIKVRFLLN